MNAWGPTQAVPEITAASSAAGPNVLASTDRSRLGGAHEFPRILTSRCTRRPRPERNPSPSTPIQKREGRCPRRVPISTRHSARTAGPSATNRLASSAAVSLAACNWRRAHQTSGCHHKTALAKSATRYQAGSRAARCASSCASIASCCAGVNLSAKHAGKPRVGRTAPKTIGPASRADSTSLTRRATPNARASASTRARKAGLTTVLRRQRKSSRRKHPTQQRALDSATPASQASPRYKTAIESATESSAVAACCIGACGRGAAGETPIVCGSSARGWARSA